MWRKKVFFFFFCFEFPSLLVLGFFVQRKIFAAMVAGKISPTGGILSSYKLGFTELSRQYNNNALVHDEGGRAGIIMRLRGVAGSFDSHLWQWFIGCWVRYLNRM